MLSRSGSHSFGSIRLEANRPSVIQNENSVANVKSLNIPTKTPGGATSKRRAFGDISNRKQLQTGGKGAATVKSNKITFQNATPAAARTLFGAPTTRKLPPKSSSKKVDFLLPQRTTTNTRSAAPKSTVKAPSVEPVELKAGKSFDPFESDDDDDTSVISLQDEIDRGIQIHREFKDGTVDRERMQNYVDEREIVFQKKMEAMLYQVEVEKQEFLRDCDECFDDDELNQLRMDLEVTSFDHVLKFDDDDDLAI